MTRNYDAFTLAEVLITLVIVGVIAAMTIPTLMNKTNKQEYVSRLKKSYSTLSQATNRIIAEQGNPRGDIGGWATSAEAVFNMYKKYLSHTKTCEPNVAGCFDDTYKHLRLTTSPNFNIARRYAFILSDGSEIILRTGGDFNNSCSNLSAGSNDVCQNILVDVNGRKGPNIVGKDVFGFVLKQDGLHPMGCDYDGECINSSDGWGCACKVLREGAINY